MVDPQRESFDGSFDAPFEGAAAASLVLKTVQATSVSPQLDGEPAPLGSVVIVGGAARSGAALRQMLGGAGFNVHDANDRDLVDVVRGAGPDLVVFDVGDDGVDADAVAALKAEPATASTPILVVSSPGVHPPRPRTLQGGRRRDGIDAALIAPVEPGELLAAVDVLLVLGAERRARLLAERQAAMHETLQSAAFQHIGDSIIVTDVDGRVMQWNAGAERIFGYSAAEMMGQSVARLAADAGTDIGSQLERHATEPPREGVEWEARTKGGDVVWLHVHTTPVRDRRGELIAFVGVAKDITEKRVANDLLLRRLELERHLIGMVSHDLRNPLNAIVLSVALLERLELPEKGVRGVERISRATKRSLRLIDDLLDFTRARRGDGMPVTRQYGDLNDILEHVVDEVRPLFPGRDLVIEAAPAPGDYDEGRMAQVLQNLIGNALQHTTTASQVRVTLQADGDEASIVVWNDGPPIAPDLLPRLFEPYQQGPSGGRAGADRGLGLGLFIAREAIKAHGGTIDVTSDSEKGTAFHVRLRRRAPPPART